MKFSRQEYWSGEDSLLQGIFQIQGSNLGLSHCRQILYHLCHQGLLKMIFKGNFGFPSDAKYNWVAFNSVFMNGLKQDISLLVKRTQMEW